MSENLDEIERRRIMMKMMMEIINKAQQKTSTKRELTREEVIQLIRRITRGERGWRDNRQCPAVIW
ncbi:hypothetical protein [Vulcanisaeta sp. JCM 16161]|uniref:hypothetical protein n=1 Tax=Vulcanisaeta sp. JCM 16161 TaxID=1295372 RepID=UPI00406D099E